MKKGLIRILGSVVLTFSLVITSMPFQAMAKTNEVNDKNSNINSILNESKLELKEEGVELLPEELVLPNLDNISENDEGNSNDKMINYSTEIDKSEEGNNYPIVLVHGFMGFGRSEMLGYKYWGGFEDIEEELNKKGYTTYTASVGPVSSNWDRACELYAYIVGGTVDYGAAHSAKYGHERYGRTFKGIYKDISDNNKIHLIGHSMGGQTIRTLTQLLSEGSEEEQNYMQDNLSPLFEGGKHWVRSVTTISAPNDGTTLSDLLSAKQFINNMIGTLGSITGGNKLINSLYDFKLDQFGLEKKKGESESSYIQRVLDSNIWTQTTDIAPYDLSTEGAEKLNKWVKAQPDVYYFSWITEASRKSLVSNHQLPKVGPMNPLFYGTSALMGKYTRNKGGLPIIDKGWFPNDGVVNSISQDGPKLGSSDIIEEFNGEAKIGQWNVMPKLKNYDHMDIVGTFAKVKDWYMGYAEQLRSLPA